MVAVFASFILNGDPTVKEFGVGLASAILIAGSMVCVLLPAVMLLMGQRTWWLPRRLDRFLPHISVEGEPRPQRRLTRSSPTHHPTPTPKEFPMSAVHTTPAPAAADRPHRAVAGALDRRRHPRRHRADRPGDRGLARLRGRQGPRGRRAVRPGRRPAPGRRRAPPRSTPRWPRSDAAASDTADHAGDAVANQVNDQADALDRAADGFVGSLTADDEFEHDLYQAELDIAVDDLTSQAEDFRTTGPEVQQAFWDGYDTGLTAE